MQFTLRILAILALTYTQVGISAASAFDSETATVTNNEAQQPTELAAAAAAPETVLETGAAAGEAAGQTAGLGGGLLSPGVLIGVLTVAGIVALALEVSTDDDQLSTSSSSSTGT